MLYPFFNPIPLRVSIIKKRGVFILLGLLSNKIIGKP
jgi:hypothetical protein